MNFPEIDPAYVPEIEISKKYWMSLLGIGLCDAQELSRVNKAAEKFLKFRKLPITKKKIFKKISLSSAILVIVIADRIISKLVVGHMTTCVRIYDFEDGQRKMFD